MKVKGMIIAFLLVIISATLILQLKDNNAFDINTFEIDKIKFFMTKEEVERLYGNGSDNSEGCMGCSMYFDYPELKISGSYSETLDRMDENGEDYSQSPKLTELTIYKENFSIMGIEIGTDFEDARKKLEKNGYKLQSDEDEYFYNYYYRGDIFIKLWPENGFNGKEGDKVEGISIEFRVLEDLGIVY